MTSPPDDSLGALQAAMGRALRGDASERPLACLMRALAPAGNIPVAARVDVYRNNAWQGFLLALERTYPVLRRRVGDDFFRQLARDFRQAHPSRSGDLHWSGQALPEWLSVRLADSDYAWLADLARLEWACEEATCARDEPPIDSSALSNRSPDTLEVASLRLHASVRTVKSPYPLFSVWQANQGPTDGAPVNFTAGGQCCVVTCVADRVALFRLEPADFDVVEVLAAGGSLGEAAAVCGHDAALLGRVLGWLFAERLIVGVSPSAPA